MSIREHVQLMKQQSPVMAASSLMIIPPMILYLTAGKHLEGGIKTSGLKG